MLTVAAASTVMPGWVTAVIVASSALAAVASVFGQVLNVILIEKRLKAQDEAREQRDAARHAELLTAIRSKETA